MKRLAVVLIVLLILFALYSYLTGDDSARSRTPSPVGGPEAIQQPGGGSEAVRPGLPAATPAPALPRPLNPNTIARTTPSYNAGSAPANLAGGGLTPRQIDIDRIIRQCAARANFKLTNLQHGNGRSRIAGVGDNTRVQEFITELQNSGILRDIESKGAVPTDRPGFMQSAIEIKWNP